MSHFEKKLSSERIYEGRILNLRRDTVELENKNIDLREVIEHPGGVCVVAVDEQDHMLFVRQYRYAVGQVLLELPAGKLEAGEEPAVCGRRELLEECGCTCDTLEPLTSFYPTCAYDTEMIYIFIARGLHFGAQQLDDDEFLTVERIPVEKAIHMALAGEIPDGKTQLGILKYAAQFIGN